VSEPHVESLFFTPGARRGRAPTDLTRLTLWQRPIRQQIIIPFFLLLIFVAVVGGAALTYQASGAGMAGFDQGLLRASVQTSDNLATLEAGRLNDLRAIAAAPGLGAALAAGDRAGLAQLLAGDARTAVAARVTIRILDASGRAILSIPADGGRVVYHDVPGVRNAVAGVSDALGDKYVALVSENSRPIVYWAAPIRNATQRVVGAALLGVPVSNLATDLRTSQNGRLFFYGPSGEPLSPSAGLVPLSHDLRQAVNPERLMRVSATVSGRTYAVAVSEWTVRGERLGYVGVALPADQVTDNVLRLRVILLLVFVGTALLVLLAGGLLSRRIARPLEELVSSMSDISASLDEKTKAVEKISFASVEALARAIDARDSYTYGHSTRVARLSLELADAMSLPAEAVMALGRAALLHDIGKIGVEDRVLRKPGPLTARERAAMRQHPVIGYEMLKGLDFLQPSLTGVRHHHEHWNGTGYPDGLRGDDIPLPVRILTVADALDALTSDRPYRNALSFPAALEMIEAGSESQFDPAVVRALRSRGQEIATLLVVMGKLRAASQDVFEVPAR
jgi:putative nucleotidyltransferase with HDIG domain